MINSNDPTLEIELISWMEYSSVLTSTCYYLERDGDTIFTAYDKIMELSFILNRDALPNSIIPV